MSNMLELRPMSISDAMQICHWRYEAPYDCYNLPSWNEMTEQDIEFANEQIRKQQYRALYQQTQLVGFIQLFPMLLVIRLAIFLAPNYCNKGLGRDAVELAVQAAKALDPNAEIDLEVECWNKRAIACYSKAGFVITDEYEVFYRGNSKLVYCMVYQGNTEAKNKASNK